MTGNRFRILFQDSRTAARIGIYETAHGAIQTPYYAPVGTQGAVKAVTHEMLEAMGYPLILANTYHLYLRPGHETIRSLGGIHRFIAWPHAILTDSGGYQVFSLARLRRVTDDGIFFQSHLDGSQHTFTPERAVEIQEILGSDIAMVLDECPPANASREELKRAVDRTIAWAVRSRRVHRRDDQSLWGILQGGLDFELRRRCAEAIRALDFDGYAAGGISVGEPKDQMYATITLTARLLPDTHIRYLMGVGLPHDIIYAVMQGFDFFDCVVPTRHARNGYLFTHEGPLHIKNAQYKTDVRPPDPTCGCPVCQRYSRAYLRHLFMANEIMFTILNTLHNLYFYKRLMDAIHEAIRAGTLADLYVWYASRYEKAEAAVISPPDPCG